MKFKFLKISQLMLICSVLFYSQLSFGGRMDVEFSGSMLNIVSAIDTKKKVISIGGNKLAYNATTIFHGYNGQKTDITALRVGLAIRFKFNQSERYISQPTATEIWIKSSHPLLAPKR